MTNEAVEHFLSQATELPGMNDVAWLDEHRKAATHSLSTMGFPTRRVEEWKYTDVSPILNKKFSLSIADKQGDVEAILSSAKISDLDCHQLVFINGHFSKTHSCADELPEDVSIVNLKEAISKPDSDIGEYLNKYHHHEKNGFVALNTTLITDGAVIWIGKNVEFKKPVNLIFVSTGSNNTASNIRNLIVAGINSQVDVIETYAGIDSFDYFTNTVTEVYLEDGANLNHYKIQEEGDSGYHVGNLFVSQQQNSAFNSYQVSIGGKLVRSDLDINLSGTNAQATLYGLYMAEDSQHVDHHTTVNHISPNTRSNETYRGVLGDKARGVFNGKIIVHKDAQKTEAHLSNANLLLSSEAEVDTKPELEIYADDVKCSHGATIGRLDDTMLYYLRTRAIAKDVARSLLTFAFAEDVIEKINYPQICKRLQKKVIGKLPDSNVIEDFVQ